MINHWVFRQCPLKRIFGETPATKILDFLIDHVDYDYSKTEIAEHAGIGWTTINRYWKNLEDWKLVTPIEKDRAGNVV
ncbi:MAG: helix-turn-helix transcriptional regulator [Euryarchaeota archaeon]|nr:helix-turn-helix transcriptional regulator [Euryarchaeota archaeon]